MKRTLKQKCKKINRKKCCRLLSWSNRCSQELRLQSSSQCLNIKSSHQRGPVGSPLRYLMSYLIMNHVILARSNLKGKIHLIPRKNKSPKKKQLLDRGRGERSTSAHTLTKSTMPRTCATTATTEKERQKWPVFVVIPTGLTTQVVCAKTVTLPSTT